jgi:ribosomal protein S18 acetylase RimI-like enzyme
MMAPERDAVTVRPLAAGDVAAVVRLHEEAFADNFMTTFGPGFLRAFYEGLAANGEGYVCVVTAGEGGPVVGFCAGGAGEVQGIARRMLRVRPWAFAWPAFVNFVRSPSRIKRGVQVARRNLGPGAPAGDGDEAPERTALLMQIAVAAEHRGTGAADALVADFLAAMRERGAERVNLGVEADNGRAIGFYRRLGFEDLGPGMLTYAFEPEGEAAP